MFCINNKKSIFVYDEELVRTELLKNDNEYVKEDVVVRIADNKIFVRSKSKKLRKIEIIFDYEIDKNSLFLSDKWERAYADMGWKKYGEDNIMPWYFLSYNNGVTNGYGVKTLPNSMCYWKIVNDKVCFISDISSGGYGVRLNDRELLAAELVFYESKNNVFESCREFCRLMCDKKRTVEHKIYGGNDWYCNYGNNTYDKIIEHTKRIVECSKDIPNPPYMVIDDGWQICHHIGRNDYESFNGGPWKYANSKFEDMKKLATEIKEIGAIPGLWFRPLQTAENAPDNYILKRDGIKIVLDPSVDDVLKRISDDISTIKEWGYKLIKHDFSSYDIFDRWGVENDEYLNTKTRFHDDTRTTAEIIKTLYMTIREAAADDVVIIGCNTISHLSAGIFEIQRTGDDTSGREWETTKKMGVNTLAFRMMQHDIFYLSDADCVGVTNQVPWEKNCMWLDVLAKSGTPFFVSIAEDAFGDVVKEKISEAFVISNKINKCSEPTDWLENNIPAVWKTELGIDEYDW